MDKYLKLVILLLLLQVSSCRNVFSLNKKYSAACGHYRAYKLYAPKKYLVVSITDYEFDSKRRSRMYNLYDTNKVVVQLLDYSKCSSYMFEPCDSFDVTNRGSCQPLVNRSYSGHVLFIKSRIRQPYKIAFLLDSIYFSKPDNIVLSDTMVSKAKHYNGWYGW